MSFLTLEDVNGTFYSNQGFFWHCIDFGVIGDKDFEDVKIDFCEASRTTSGSYYSYALEIKNDYFAVAFYLLDEDNNLISSYSASGGVSDLIVSTTYKNVKILLYMGLNKYNSLTEMEYVLKDEKLDLTYKELSTSQKVKVIDLSSDEIVDSDSLTLTTGFNNVTCNGNDCGFLLVKLAKSDFQFNCTQQLTLGKVNTVKLGTLADYKPNGDMIGANTPKITVLYKDTYIPVVWNSSLNDYVFNIDLSDNEIETNIRFNVIIETNDVLNASTTSVTLHCNYEPINNATKLATLFKNGGVGRLSANITINEDLTLNKDVYIVGNDKTLTMQNHKIIVPTERTFKAENVTFNGGNNTIQQNNQSKVDLKNSDFINCIGLGSVIDCQVDIHSLENPTDFTTLLTNCNISNCDMAILHGGDLTVDGCTVNGKIGNKNYPFFLYQTDGNANITNSTFSLTSNTLISNDIGFNSCIFICGEGAVINNGNHSEWQNNNLMGFLTNSNNNSTINITYYYDVISDYITLSSSNGYCHNTSNTDYVFKNNITLTRSD